MIYKDNMPQPPDKTQVKRSGSESWTDRLKYSVNQPGKEGCIDERYINKPIKTIEWY